MRLPKSWVAPMTKRIIDDLVKRGYIESTVPEKDLLVAVEGILLYELMAEDRLNDEVRGILQLHSSEIEEGRLDYRRLFDLTKRKLAKERNIVL